MEYLNKLKKYLEENKAGYDLISFGNSAATYIEAAQQIGEESENLVKSIVFYKKDIVITVIIRKEDRVDKTKISKNLGMTGIKLCSPDETLEKTGYPAGGVPPLGFQAEFLMDKKVAEKNKIIAGGGNKYTLLRMKTQQLLNLNKAKILNIRKE